MSTDALTRLRAADPARDVIVAPEHLLHRLVAEPRPAPRPRAGRRRRVALAVVACAGSAAVAAVALPGGAGRAPDARAQLVAAAQRTADYTSGRVTWKLSFEPPVSTWATQTTMVLRFDGNDWDEQYHTHSAPNRYDPVSDRFSEIRTVGGRSFLREGADGPWTLAIPPDRKGHPPTWPTVTGHVAQWQQAADAILALARRAPDLTGSNGSFHATIDTAQVPRGFERFDFEESGPLAMDATLGPDGNVGHLSLRGAHVSYDVSFEDLGRPQGIVAP
jgi:hypothetical protein